MHLANIADHEKSPASIVQITPTPGPRLAKLKKAAKGVALKKQEKQTHHQKVRLKEENGPIQKVKQAPRPRMSSKKERFAEEVAALGPHLARLREAALDKLAKKRMQQ